MVKIPFSLIFIIMTHFKNSLKSFLLGSVAIMMLPLLGSCKDEGQESAELSAEEIRVKQSTAIDTVSLRSVLNPDSIEGVEALEKVSAEAWILIEDSTGMLINSKNATKRMFPASLAKMMTTILALEHGHLDDTVTITNDVFIVKDARVRLGDGFLFGNLINEMVLQSDNDAAYAVAKHVGGDTLAFCKMMNDRAAYLGLDSTHFANPNGMPNDSTYSSARDLMVLARYCMRDSTFASIVGTPKKRIPMVDGRYLDIENTNLLLTSYEGCFGVKTGYTRQAGGCLATAATRNGVTLYLVMLKSRSRSSRFSESKLLFDYGFKVMEKYKELKG